MDVKSFGTISNNPCSLFYFQFHVMHAQILFKSFDNHSAIKNRNFRIGYFLTYQFYKLCRLSDFAIRQTNNYISVASPVFAVLNKNGRKIFYFSCMFKKVAKQTCDSKTINLNILAIDKTKKGIILFEKLFSIILIANV